MKKRIVLGGEEVISVSLGYDSDNNIVLRVDGEDIGYFDEDGLNLMVFYKEHVLADENKLLKIRKHDEWGNRID